MRRSASACLTAFFFAASSAHADMASQCAAGAITEATTLGSGALYGLIGTCELRAPGSLSIQGGRFDNKGQFLATSALIRLSAQGTATNGSGSYWGLTGSVLSVGSIGEAGTFTNLGTVRATSSTVNVRSSLKNLDGGVIYFQSQSTVTNAETDIGILNQNGSRMEFHDASILRNLASITNNQSARISLASGATWSNLDGAKVSNSNGSTITVNNGAVLANSYMTNLVNEYNSTITSGGANGQGAARIDNLDAMLRNRYNASLNNLAGSTLNNTGSKLLNEHGSTVLNADGAALNNRMGASIQNDWSSVIRNQNGASIVNQQRGVIYNSGASALINSNYASIVNERGGSTSSADNSIIYNIGSGTRLINEAAAIITNGLGGQINNVNGATLLNGSGAKIFNRSGGAISNIGTGSSIVNTGVGTLLTNDNGASIDNMSGAMIANGTGATLHNNGLITNSGTLQNAGIFALGASGLITGNGTFQQLGSGSLLVDGVMIQSRIDLLGGSLQGHGKLVGDVAMQDTRFEVGGQIGDFHVDGRLSAAGSTLVFRVGGITLFDQLISADKTTLSASTLRFDFSSWLDEIEGQSFDFLRSTDVQWSGISVESVGLRDGLYASVSQVDGGLRVTLVPEPSSWLMAMGGLLLLAAPRLKRGRPLQRA